MNRKRSKQVKKAMAAPAKKGWPKSNRKQYPVPPPKYPVPTPKK